MKRKVSDLVVEFLERKGVEHVFLLSGGMMMHLLDSLSRSKTIKYVCNHHEQFCTTAAEGNARIRGKPGVCFATSGPGATNTLTGVAGAWLDSTPLLVLTGQSRTSLTVRGSRAQGMRMVGTFEVDIVAMAAPVTKRAVFVDDPKQIIFELERAWFEATTGRPGPVLLDLPLDVQGALVEEADLVRFVPPVAVSRPTLDLSALEAGLRRAKRPLVLAGHGVRVCAQAEQFLQFVDRLKLPVVTTQLGQDLIPFDHPLNVGRVGLRGQRAANFAVQACDLLIVVGCSLHVTATGYDPEYFAPNAELHWFDLDEANLSRNAVSATFRTAASVGDVLDSARSLQVESTGWAEWTRNLARWKRSLPVSADHPKVGFHTYNIVESMSVELLGSETIVTDAGSLYYIVGQSYRAKEGQRVLVSGSLGAMGYALPASIGASLANPTNKVVCITGDGSLQMCVQELATVSYNGIDIIIVVINNDGYASIRNTQVTFCGGNIAATGKDSGLLMPVWADVCNSYRIQHKRCETLVQFQVNFGLARRSKGPIVLECVIDSNVALMPAVTSKKLSNGSFVSSRLHEMSPAIETAVLEELGIDENLVALMGRRVSRSCA